jgi:hypothetical protein
MEAGSVRFNRLDKSLAELGHRSERLEHSVNGVTSRVEQALGEMAERRLTGIVDWSDASSTAWNADPLLAWITPRTSVSWKVSGRSPFGSATRTPTNRAPQSRQQRQFGHCVHGTARGADSGAGRGIGGHRRVGRGGGRRARHGGTRARRGGHRQAAAVAGRALEDWIGRLGNPDVEIAELVGWGEDEVARCIRDA